MRRRSKRVRAVLDAEPPNHTRRAAPWSLHSPSRVTEIELCPSRSLATLIGTPFSSHVVEALCSIVKLLEDSKDGSESEVARRFDDEKTQLTEENVDCGCISG